ncbi:MAG: right-handed parallel beta-helix repeat-containing protein, partial [Caldilinea sp.]
SVTGTLTLVPNSNLPYLIGSEFQVPQGQTLIYTPGVVTKFSRYGLDIAGAFYVQGTKENPVYFTSLKDDTVDGDSNQDGTATSPAAGDWYSIHINATGAAIVDYAVVRDGGTSSYAAITAEGGKLTITNSTISHNTFYGVYVTDASPVITNTHFFSNVGGLSFYSPSSALVNPIVRDNEKD